MLTATEWDALIDAMREQRTPSLRANEQMTNAILSRIAELDHITRLDLEGSRQLTDIGLANARTHAAIARARSERLHDHRRRTRRAAAPAEPAEISSTLARRHQRRRGMANLAFCTQLESVTHGTATGDGAIRALAGKSSSPPFQERLVS
jgi:hypothetical protein